MGTPIRRPAVGQRFGKLTVLGEAPSVRNTASICACDCGTEKTVLNKSLFRLPGGTRSCGCLKAQKALVTAVGQRFGKLTVLGPAPVQHGDRASICACDCGTEKTVTNGHLLKGETRSCGCLKRDTSTTHGLHGHPLYQTWKGMMARCYDQDHMFYRYYGGRGISVCPRWHDVAAFIEDIERILGPRPDGYTLDRKRNGLGYKPSNVRWATAAEQMANRRKPCRI